MSGKHRGKYACAKALGLETHDILERKPVWLECMKQGEGITTEATE